jgi:arginine decarboxylase
VHNLFGDTNAVHVRLGENREVILDSVIKGDTVREVLNYVQFSSDALVSKLRRDVEAALRDGRLGYEECGRLLRFHEEGLHGYTYLEDVHER